jgi:DNA adenine methylase
MTGAARPILKWAGGKQALAARLVERFPSDFDRYFEPFVGGASVFLALGPARAVLSDRNRWLIETYEAVRDDAPRVAEVLARLPNTREDYLRIRAIDPRRLGPVRRAAHFVYLNKTGFRGLFRVNRQGRFNVPYGAYARRYFDPDNLLRFAERLRRSELRCGDFESGLAGVSARDFVYLDPPYHKLGGYSDFDRYTDNPFREPDHERLADACRALDRRGVRFLLSQSDTPYVRRLFDGFRLERIAARREIQLRSSRRGAVELVIANAWPRPQETSSRAAASGL